MSVRPLRLVAGLLLLAAATRDGAAAASWQKGAPQFETQTLLTTSYVPAAMQVIAHLTDALKFELRPQQMAPFAPTPTTTTSTQRPPTAPHRPGVYQPHAQAQQHDADARSLYDDDDADNLQLLGAAPRQLHRVVDAADHDDTTAFLAHFDDNALTLTPVALASRAVGVTRAYVQLLTVYDLLQKEAKRIGLQFTAGYAPSVLADVQQRPLGARSAGAQLLHVLVRVQQTQVRGVDAQLTRKMAALVDELATPDSYMQMALQGIAPLAFAD